jgi:hypothetical protein
MQMQPTRQANVAGTSAERTLARTVSSGASLMFASLQGYCGLVGLAGGVPRRSRVVALVNSRKRTTKCN